MNTNVDHSAMGEANRLEVLNSYGVLDTPPDESLDQITRLTAKLFQVPIAAVSLVDDDRIWFKSTYGLQETSLSREAGLCAAAILDDTPFLVEDTTKDSRTRSKSWFAGGKQLKFYSAVPLRTREGINLGTLCIMDFLPREQNSEEVEVLQDLAEMVMNQIELQLEARNAVQDHYRIVSTAAHDLKNPISIMPLLADLIMENKENPAAIDDISKQIKEAGRRMGHTINDLIENALNNNDQIHLRLKGFDFCKLTRGVVSANQTPARKKGQTLRYHGTGKCRIYADHRRITELVDNLVNNAVKFSGSNATIDVYLKSDQGKAVLQITDEGPGMTSDDLKNIFRKFTSLSAEPTGGETSTGLGMYIAKEIVQAHRGTISVESEGKGKGACFTVEIPLAEN